MKLLQNYVSFHCKNETIYRALIELNVLNKQIIMSVGMHKCWKLEDRKREEEKITHVKNFH